MGFPARGARAFPGKREEANRAGITPRILVGTIDHSIVDGSRGGSSDASHGRRQTSISLFRMPVEHRFAVNGIEIALWEWPGQDPAVFFCHATGFHGRCWDQTIAALPGRHCYASDARGPGRRSVGAARGSGMTV